MAMARIDFWFEFASTYSYPAAMRIEALAAKSGIEVRWRPFLLGAVFRDRGLPTDSPFNWQEAKGRLMARDLERLCDGVGLAFKMPDPFPQPSLLPARVAAFGLDSDWLPDFARHVYTAEFADGRQINDRETVAAILSDLGLPAEDVLAGATTPENKGRLKALTEEAMSLGLFGAPTIVTADGELFWGHDRIPEALHWALNGSLKGYFDTTTG